MGAVEQRRKTESVCVKCGGEVMGLACLEVGDPAVQETQRGTNATYVDQVGEEGAVGAGQQRRHPHGSFFCGVISELCCFADGEVRRSVCASFHVRRNVPDPVGRRRLLAAASRRGANERCSHSDEQRKCNRIDRAEQRASFA